MTRKLVLLIAALFAVKYGSAQNLKFGKPSKEEWALAACEEAPDAPAVVLCKKLSLTYSFNSSFQSLGTVTELNENTLHGIGANKLITSEGTTMLYNVKMRTKILKDEGRDYANLDIIYYYSKNDFNKRDDFYSFKVTLFSNDNGKVKKMKLDNMVFQDEPISNDFRVRHVRIPQAKAGNIVEIEYELFSSRIAYIFDWQLQDEIPVRYSSCELTIPCFLNFNVNAAIRQNVKSKVDMGYIYFKQNSNDMSPARKCICNIYRIEAQNMLPWSQDPVRNVKGSAIAQVLSTISTANIQGIPYPISQPEGRKWITVSPK